MYLPAIFKIHGIFSLIVVIHVCVSKYMKTTYLLYMTLLVCSHFPVLIFMEHSLDALRFVYDSYSFPTVLILKLKYNYIIYTFPYSFSNPFHTSLFLHLKFIGVGGPSIHVLHLLVNK